MPQTCPATRVTNRCPEKSGAAHGSFGVGLQEIPRFANCLSSSCSKLENSGYCILTIAANVRQDWGSPLVKCGRFAVPEENCRRVGMGDPSVILAATLHDSSSHV